MLTRSTSSLMLFALAALGLVSLHGQTNYATPYAFTTLAGNGSGGATNGAGTNAQFRRPLDVALDSAGNLYVADTDNHVIRKISASGSVSTLAGVAGSSGSTDGSAIEARFTRPAALALDGQGNVYVVDGRYTIRKVSSSGAVTTLAGAAGVSGTADGAGSAARFKDPKGIAVDASGNLYVADFAGHTIRKVTSDGVVTTFAGSPNALGMVNANGSAARFSFPYRVAVDGNGTVYVIDSGNVMVRKISSSGVVSTVAGQDNRIGWTDGGPAVALFYSPTGIAVDSAGNLFIADEGAHTIRRIGTDGIVTTLAGLPSMVGSMADGAGSIARFQGPHGLAVSSSGRLYVADAGNHAIRAGALIVPTISLAAASGASEPTHGEAVTLTAPISSTGATYQWLRNGRALDGKTTATLALASMQPGEAGMYEYSVALPGGAGGRSETFIVGLSSSAKVIGSGAEIASDVFVAANGNTFDQVLPDGPAVTVTADHALNQITRTSFVDLTNDIVQVEMSGPGSLTLVLDATTEPATALNYNQGTLYMKGHAGIVITGATEATNVTVFSVGKITAVNQALFKSEVSYDGLADLAFVAVKSSNGKFGGIRTSNASYYATKGFTGVYAPGVDFTGPVFIGDIRAADDARPVIVIGSSSDTRITGGDLEQANGQPVTVAGLTELKFTKGSDSHGTTFDAKTNRAVLLKNGSDVTESLVVYPGF